MLRLRIKLKSGLCAGSGVGRPGFVDREVAFDRYGLPYVPGRTLKGLLRDAYRQLPPSLLPGLPDIDEIFGRPGAVTPGCLEIGTARLDSYSRLRAWLHAAQSDPQLRTTIRRDDVLESFTEIRSQTAMDRETGAPLEDTLRATRLLRPGLTLESEVGGLVTDSLRRGVALAAAALKQMGSSRNRGFGEVECSLWENGENLTEAAVKALSEGTIQFTGAAQTQTKTPPPVTEDQTTCVLRFSLELQEGAVFPTLESDANTVLSETFVPGSAVRGMLAWRWIRNYGDGPDFSKLFLGGVQFLAATPSTSDDRRALPVPHSLRESKDNAGVYYDLVAGQPPVPVRRIRGWISGANATGSRLVDVETDLHYHHQRAADARVGRALGQEEEAAAYGLDATEAGALFTYESLAPGNRFRGAIAGPRQDLQLIATLVEDGEVVRLGRSTSAQYGGKAVWKWDRSPLEMGIKSEALGWRGCQIQDKVEAGKCFQITLLAPLLARTPEGHPAARLLIEDLAEALGQVKLEITRSFARTTTQGGYLAHQRLPREQVPALAAGSVFVVRTSQDISAEALNRAAARSWGMRTEDGFGRIAISVPSTERNPHLRRDLGKQTSWAQDLELTGSDPARDLALDLFKRRVAERAVLAALHEAAEYDRRVKDRQEPGITNHLLSRLSGMVTVTPLQELPARLDKLRPQAKKQLGSLEKILQNASGEHWQERYQEFVQAEMGSVQEAGGERRHWWRLFGPKGPALAPDEGVVRNYILRLLAGIARMRRKVR